MADHSSSANASRPKLKLRLSPAAEKAVRQGHPWVYADRVRDPSRSGDAGELAIIYDRRDRFLGIGLYDPDSPIAVRVLHTGSPVTLDDGWWRNHFKCPLEKRRLLFDDETTNGYRCVNGESDGWPGLVLDRYADTLVLKLYTAAWFPHLHRILALISGHFESPNIVLRLSRNTRIAAEQVSLKDGDILAGQCASDIVVFRENGLLFEADVRRGQKTGFFLDQRENRLRVREFSKDGDLLNVFSHAGGFSVHAAAGGARSVTDLDISGHGLDAARRNMVLNQTSATISGAQHSIVKADAFQWLAHQSDVNFDVVVIDPPSFAKRESEKEGALASYQTLAAHGLRLLRRGGLLVAASCSAHVTAEEFFQTIRSTAERGQTAVKELFTTAHAPDHPATIPEARYLKCIYLRRW